MVQSTKDAVMMDAPTMIEKAESASNMEQSENLAVMMDASTELHEGMSASDMGQTTNNNEVIIQRPSLPDEESDLMNWLTTFSTTFHFASGIQDA